MASRCHFHRVQRTHHHHVAVVIPTTSSAAHAPLLRVAAASFRDAARCRGRGCRSVYIQAGGSASDGSEKAQWLSPVEVGRRLAALRAEDPSIDDPFAAALAAPEGESSGASPESTAALAAAHSISTQYLDDILIKATAFVADNRDYRQVVLVGAATDTRPFRLPWYEGTVIYLVSPADAHQAAAAALKDCPDAHVPRGCLLKRVPADLQGGTGFIEKLELAGFQSGRLSVWCLQGLHELGLGMAEIEPLLLDISIVCAYGSQICGEVEAPSGSAMDNTMAELGFRGCSVPLEAAAEENGRLAQLHQIQEQSGRRLLFHGEQSRLSFSQMDTYHSHVAAAEETDEDFFDNFS